MDEDEFFCVFLLLLFVGGCVCLSWCFPFFVLFVGFFGGCVTTFWFVFLSLFCFLFDLLFALGCGCRIFHVAAVADAMLGKLWVRVAAS